MSFSISKTQAELIAATEMRNHCDLQQVALLRCSVDGAGPVIVPARPTPLDVSFQAAYTPSNNPLEVEIIIHVNGLPHLVFHIDVTILLKYEIAPGFVPTQEDLLAFSDLIAIGDAWPYAREFIQDLTSRMGLPTSPLPTLRIVAQNGGKRRLSSGRRSAKNMSQPV
jgi:hypothetical protein